LFLPFLINYYDKVILLDTDTIVIESIDNLYNIDVSTVCAGFCHDWATPGTLSPTNGLVNLHNMGKDFFTPDGLFEKFANLIINSDKNKFVFSEAVQKLMHEMFYNRCLILDKSWNVPITHRHLYDIAKIFHFSESWAGKKEVLSAYEKLVNKYLCDNKINL
jgi:lipopolysaccharide biosynthesis glycosyltransferase